MCTRCNGMGRDTYDDDDRRVTDVCYHCGGEGTVGEETAYHDRLHAVAAQMAHHEESQVRKWADEEPDGDGYSMRAYEEMMSVNDYFRAQVWSRTERIGAELAALPREAREVLLAWSES